jgi:hypothetical protein
VGVPLADDIDVSRLAKLTLNGASIKSIAMAAAFLAAQAGPPVTMEMVIDAVREEHRKLNRPFNESDLAVRPRRLTPEGNAA